jgi:hypothetical protein
MMEPIKENTEIKEYADGWITERKGTDVPMFLKVAFIVIAGGCLTYFFLYLNGEETHSDRGVLVRTFNAVTGTSNGFMYVVAGLGVIFAIVLVTFVFKKFHEE